jgi:arylsulfatase
LKEGASEMKNEKKHAKPNILFIMADQFRLDAVGHIGHWTKTDNLNRLADEGITFTNCVTNTPICMPARVSLATGRYPHNTGLWNNVNSFFLGKEEKTWMQEIRNNGYRTSLFGKTHLYSHLNKDHYKDLREYEDFIHAYGIDDVNETTGPRACVFCKSHMTEVWERKGYLTKFKEDMKDRYENNPFIARPCAVPLEDYMDVYVGQQAKKYLQEYNREEPWFCWVSFGGPHEPWDAPEPYHSMYDTESMPAPISATEKIFSNNRPKGLLDEKKEKTPEVSVEDIKKLRANYAGNVTLIDDQIGEILKVIEERGESDNTIIVFTSDHGEMNGDYGLFYKSNFLNPALKIPLIVRTPGTLNSDVRGKTTNTMVELMDIGPTLVELAGGKMDYYIDAKSFCGVLESPDSKHRDEVLAEYRDEIMYMNDEWKIVLNGSGEPYLLFNVKDDPEESVNLAGLPDVKQIERDLQIAVLKKLTGSMMRYDKGGVEKFE